MMTFLALPLYMVVCILISNVLSVLFCNTSKSSTFSTELLKQMLLFGFIIENEMRMHEENLVEVLLLYCLVQFH